MRGLLGSIAECSVSTSYSSMCCFFFSLKKHAVFCGVITGFNPENHTPLCSSPSQTCHGLHCCCSVAQLCLTLCNSMDCSTPGFPVLHYVPEFFLNFVHPTISSSVTLFSSCPQSFPASGSFHIRWPTYWSFSISLSDENSRLIYLRMDWFDLLAVQETLKSLL